MTEKKHSPISRAWNSRPAAWIAVGILITAVLVAGVSVAFSIFAPVTPGGEPTPAAAAPSTVAPTVAAAAAGCNVPVGDDSLRPAVPKDLRWVANQGLTWPVSATYGPTRSVDGFDVCFAHSPVGAALAATTVLFSQYNGHTPKKMTEFYLVDSPGKTVALRNAPSTSDPSALSGLGASVAGFMVDEYSPDRATVGIVFSSPKAETGYVSMPLTLVWVDGDWRVKPLDTGKAAPVSTPVKGQFVQWRPTDG